MAAQTLVPWKAEFLQAAVDGGVLKFGSFELKSKRISPYFFNAGDFYRARLLRALSTAYAHAIIETGLEFDVVFGPAYKGIPLATATVDKLASLDAARYDEICYSFDRKEAKDRGEGGVMVGAPLRGQRVLIVDDVVTAGTAKRDAIEKIRRAGGHVVGIVVALDRMEKLPPPDGDDNDATPMPSAIGQLRREFGIPVLAILTLDDIVAGLRGSSWEAEIPRVEEYRAKYRASD